MSPATRNRLLIVSVLALPFLVALTFLIWDSRPLPVKVTPLPNPNGYDQFLEAGSMLSGVAGAYETMSEPELVSFVATNAAALAVLRAGFSNECRVPVHYSPAYGTSRVKDLVACRSLALTLAAEGRLAELQNRPADATRGYLDIIHFGAEVGRGGLLVDAMIGVAIEGVGQTGLEKLTGVSDAALCRECAAQLETIGAHQPSWSDVLEAENLWRQSANPGLKNYLNVLIFQRKQIAENRAKAEHVFRERQYKIAALMLQFAARAYELEKGRAPSSAGDLAPDYLKAVPRDPSTGTNLVYPLR